VHFVTTPTAVLDGMLKLVNVKASEVVYATLFVPS